MKDSKEGGSLFKNQENIVQAVKNQIKKSGWFFNVFCFLEITLFFFIIYQNYIKIFYKISKIIVKVWNCYYI
jgi:hypothetical protein